MLDFILLTHIFSLNLYREINLASHAHSSIMWNALHRQFEIIMTIATVYQESLTILRAKVKKIIKKRQSRSWNVNVKDIFTLSCL